MINGTNGLNWTVALPEVVLLALACVVLLVDLMDTDPKRRTTFWLTIGSIVAVGWMHLVEVQHGISAYGMQRLVVSDPMGHLLALCACIAMVVTLVYARPYIAEREMLQGEFFTLAMFSLLGISIMVSANNFLVVYLGLEVMSLSLYALVALRRDNALATEAAMKYFVLGALASGFLLYGLSMMYGATGSLDHGTVFAAIQTGVVNKGVLVFGVVFVVAGLAFKLGAVPFHMWVPDVYHGAPTAATLLVAGAPKLAAFGITIRLLHEAMNGLAVDWQQMLMVLAMASLLVGNLVAIAQTNLKRMLAYSTIAQMGFMLLGLTPSVVGGNTLSAANGYSSSMFYLVTYVLTTLGTFGLVMLLARRDFESENLEDLAGLARRSPWMAGVMTVFVFSLAGIPPTVGFYAKLAVLQALVTTNEPVYLYLAVAAVLLSLIGAYYYLRVVKLMWFDQPAAGMAPLAGDAAVLDSGDGARLARTVLAVNGAAVLVLGLLPDGLMALCRHAINSALGG
jgi:NADH-quinone oxidoreductase subunit N